MDASYIPIAEARGFTTHWINMLFFLTLQESAARQRILQAAKLCVCIAAEGLDGSFPFSSPFFLRLRSKNLLSQERKKARSAPAASAERRW